MKRIFVLIFTLIISACSTHQTTLKQNGGYKIYAIDERDIFQLVYNEMNSIADNEFVNEIDGPERGFSTRLTFTIDWYDVFVKIVPVEGVSYSGEAVKGYFVELGGKGTYPTTRPQKMIDNIQKQLDLTGTGIMISSYRKSSYEYERDRWRLHDKASARDHDSSIFDKLLKLKLLYEEGILTEKEFENKKKELIHKI